MQRSSKVVSVLAALAVMSSGVVLVSAPAFASESAKPLGDIRNGEKIFKEGKSIMPHPEGGTQTVPGQVAEAQAGIEVPPCTTCHGETGLGDDAMGTPRLAGQGDSFIVKQLTDFATDKRMDTTMFVMNSNAKGLSESDRRDVATYVSSLEYPLQPSDMKAIKEGGTAVGVRHLGKSLAQFGAPDRGIPACHSCHGYNGRGAFPVYPRLAGQRYNYMVKQLTQWRDGSRANDPMGQMRAVAKNLTDDDIRNVATFLTSAPETTVGNTRIPKQH